MGQRYNKKYDACTFCGKKHYACGYCKKHYENLRHGRQLQPNLCKTCAKSYVSVHIKEQLCHKCYAKYIHSLHPRYKKDGGKWGYKDYRKLKSIKKTKCTKCGSKKNLVLHHKDKNTRNSQPSNLTTICQKCHISIYHTQRISKYKRLYGKTLAELAKEKNTNIYYLSSWLSAGNSLETFANTPKEVGFY